MAGWLLITRPPRARARLPVRSVWLPGLRLSSRYPAEAAMNASGLGQIFCVNTSNLPSINSIVAVQVNRGALGYVYLASVYNIRSCDCQTTVVTSSPYYEQQVARLEQFPVLGNGVHRSCFPYQRLKHSPSSLKQDGQRCCVPLCLLCLYYGSRAECGTLRIKNLRRGH